MDLLGLARACRYSYPPNSLSLCGPNKQMDLSWYTAKQKPDSGTREILSEFGTLYPYLVLIASHNHIADPFDGRVVEAYWLGNMLLFHVPVRQFARHLTDTLNLKKKIPRVALENVLTKLDDGGVPHHAFHVLAIYKRTGHIDIEHTIQTMDACLINWGKVVSITKEGVKVETQRLITSGEKLSWQEHIHRTLMFQGEKDAFKKEVKVGGWVSYHWGYVCETLTPQALLNLRAYTNLSIRLVNQKAVA